MVRCGQLDFRCLLAEENSHGLFVYNSIKLMTIQGGGAGKYETYRTYIGIELGMGKGKVSGRKKRAIYPIDHVLKLARKLLCSRNS